MGAAGAVLGADLMVLAGWREDLGERRLGMMCWDVGIGVARGMAAGQV